MSDKKVIDFEKLKNTAQDSDVEKFEQYIYSMYGEVSSGKLNMFEFSAKITKYMQDNNISNEKFQNIQRKLISKYGYDPDNLDEELKSMGIDPKNVKPSDLGFNNENTKTVEEDVKKEIDQKVGTMFNTAGFYEKYSEKLDPKTIVTYDLKNEKNNIYILVEKNKITLCSEKKIDLSDKEVNQFITDFRATSEKGVTVVFCETTSKYEYL